MYFLVELAKGSFTPKPLTEPCLTLSHHKALVNKTITEGMFRISNAQIN
jgi:hypothetical protein